MGCCFECFWTEKDNNGNEVSQSDFLALMDFQTSVAKKSLCRILLTTLKRRRKLKKGKVTCSVNCVCDYWTSDVNS